MLATMDFVETRDALKVRIRRLTLLSERLVSSLAAGACAGVFGRVWSHSAMAILLGLVAGSITLLLLRLMSRTELRITQLEFVSKGRVGENPGALRTVS